MVTRGGYIDTFSVAEDIQIRRHGRDAGRFMLNPLIFRNGIEVRLKMSYLPATLFNMGTVIP